jgi:hypothetical protein
VRGPRDGRFGKAGGASAGTPFLKPEVARDVLTIALESMEMLGIRLLLPVPRPPCQDTNA